MLVLLEKFLNSQSVNIPLFAAMFCTIYFAVWPQAGLHLMMTYFVFDFKYTNRSSHTTLTMIVLSKLKITSGFESFEETGPFIVNFHVSIKVKFINSQTSILQMLLKPFTVSVPDAIFCF